MEYYCFVCEMSTRGWLWISRNKILEPMRSTRGTKDAQWYISFHKKNEVSMNLGHKSAVHVHSSGIWMLKWTSPTACCSPSMEYYCFVSKMNTRGLILELKKRPPGKRSSMYPPYFPCKTKVAWVLRTNWRLTLSYPKLTIILIDLTKYTKFKLC